MDNNLSTAPPPPSEVKVRTMRSDLESMAKSGGGMPSFTNVKVSGLDAPKAPGMVAVRAKSKSNFLVIILVLVLIAILAVAGWFAYTVFLGNRQPTQTSEQQPQTQATGAATTTASNQSSSNVGTVPVLALGANPTSTTGTTPTTPFTHVSFFKTPADQVLKLSMASSSQSFNQQLIALLGTANKNSTVLEVDAKDTSGNPASVNELLAAQNAEVLNPLTLASDFNPDATFFVYRDKNGFWPGYVIGLAPNETWITVEGGVQQAIESPSATGNIANLFITTNIGTPSADGFTDSVIASSSVRVLPFFGGTIPAYFVYGWTPDHAYLILSTSQNGFAAALTHLGY